MSTEDEEEEPEPDEPPDSLDDIGFVEGLPEEQVVLSIAAGGNTTCVVVEMGDLYCWGAELSQRPSFAFYEATLMPDVFTVEQVAMTSSSVCVRLVTGRVQCFGGNAFGELGNAQLPEEGGEPIPTVDSVTPVDVASVTDARLIGCGYRHCCAVRTSGTTVCWGTNIDGQLGIDSDLGGPFPPVSAVDMLN